MKENIENLSDEEIIKKVINLDQDFYSVIINRYQNKLLRYAFNLIRDKNRASDIVQESFIKAFINLKSFNLNKKFSSWIYRIVHNQSINLAKKYNKEILLEDNWDFESEENIEENFDKKEIIERVKECLENIPLIYSEVISLYFIEEKNYEEISDILKIPMGTVATRISRGKKIIKKICQKK